MNMQAENPQNQVEFLTKYGKEVAAIAAAIAQKKAQADTNSEAMKSPTESLTAQLRAFATKTAEDGVSVEDGREGLRFALTAFKCPTGSVKASGNHYAGYRKLLADGVNIETKSVAEAQKAIESNAVTVARDVKKALNAYAKEHKWGADEWLAFAKREGLALDTVSREDAESIEDEVEAQEAQAAA